jgi:hypothetical protein
MSDPDEYVEPDKNRRRLAFVAVPTAVIALVLLDHFADRELQDYLRYLDTLALEGLEREILRLTHLSYLLAALGTAIWVALSLFVYRHALNIWQSQRFPLVGTRTAFRTRVRKGAEARTWSVLVFSLIPASAIPLIVVPYYLLWALRNYHHV